MIWVALFIIVVAAFNGLFLADKLPFLGSPPKPHPIRASEKSSTQSSEVDSVTPSDTVARGEDNSGNVIGEEATPPNSIGPEEGKLLFTLPSDTKVSVYFAVAIIGLPIFFAFGITDLEVIAFSSIPVRFLLVAPIAATLWLLLAGWGRRHSRSYYVRLKSAGWLAVAPFLVQGMGAPFTTAVGVLMTRILWGLVIMGVVVFIAMPIYFFRSRRIVDERKS